MSGSYIARGLRRSKSEMASLDPQIATLYQEQLTYTEIADRLKLDRSLVFRRLQRLQLVGARPTIVRIHPVPFEVTRKAPAHMNGLIAEALATTWFLEHGYQVAKPVAANTPYDLVVESDEGMKKIQVKYTSSRNSSSDSMLVRVSRITRATGNVVYDRRDVDLFFVVAEPEDGQRDYYLIPFDAVEGKQFIVLDNAFADYKV